MQYVTVRQNLARRANEIYERADYEGRAPTNEEEWQAKALLDECDQLKALDHGEGWNRPNVPALSGQTAGYFDMAGMYRGMPYDDPGARLVNSDGFKAIQRPEGRSQIFSSGLIPVTNGPPGFQMKGTLLESPGGGGGAFVSIPELVPGVVSKLFQPLSIEQALNARTTASPTVRYVQQGTATSGASGVAEGGAKPESMLGFSTVDEPVKKVATVTIVSQEMIEDTSAVQQFVNGQLVQFVNVEVERELLRGAAGGNEVQGLLTSRGVPVYTGGTADNKAVQLFKAANSMRGSAYLEPDWYVVNYSDYEAIRLLKDSQGQLFGGGPYFGPYGSGTPVSASGQVTGATDYLWGKPAYVTSALGAGTALVGTRSGAEVWNRSGVSIEITNSGSTAAGTDLFTHDLLCIRCERRLALACYRPAAYVETHLV
jgi:HK97 family phage major capsid protein